MNTLIIYLFFNVMFVEMVFAVFYFVRTVHDGDWFQWLTLVVIH